jgi:hypothetical protein
MSERCYAKHLPETILITDLGEYEVTQRTTEKIIENHRENLSKLSVALILNSVVLCVTSTTTKYFIPLLKNPEFGTRKWSIK